MATQYSILACKIPLTEEPRGLQSMGPQRVGYNSVIEHTWLDIWLNYLEIIEDVVNKKKDILNEIWREITILSNHFYHFHLSKKIIITDFFIQDPQLQSSMLYAEK